MYQSHMLVAGSNYMILIDFLFLFLKGFNLKLLFDFLWIQILALQTDRELGFKVLVFSR